MLSATDMIGALRVNIDFQLVIKELTFNLSLIEPLPRTIILHPVYCSNSLAVIPRGPNIRPTKLN